MCRMWWPLTLTYIFKVIWPWLWKSCLLCNVFSSRSIIFLTWDPIVWVIMRRRSSCSSLTCRCFSTWWYKAISRQALCWLKNQTCFIFKSLCLWMILLPFQGPNFIVIQKGCQNPAKSHSFIKNVLKASSSITECHRVYLRLPDSALSMGTWYSYLS